MTHEFSFFRYPATTTQPYKHITLYDAYLYITGTYARKQTELLRSINDPKQARQYKCSHFDFATFSGTFTTRRDDALVTHSGYLCLDFDHLGETPVPDGPRVITPCGRLDEIRRLLLDDPHFETLLLFTSPSGNGLKWVIEIGAADSPLPLTKCTGKGCQDGGIGAVHRTWFNAVRNYLATTYHLDADPACVNVSRSCFLPHDPDCYIAPRLLPELEPTIEANPAVEDLMVSLGATNISIVNLAGDTIADKTSENNEQAE